MSKALIFFLALFPASLSGQFLLPIMQAPPASGGARTIIGTCFANDYQPASGITACTTALTVSVNDVLIAFTYTDGTAFTTPISASCVSSWSTTTGTAVHNMASSVGVVTSSGSCTPQFTASTVSNNNAIGVFQCQNCSGSFDATPLFKSGGFGTPTTTSTITSVTNGDILAYFDVNNVVSTTYTSISFSDGTSTTVPLNGLFPGTNGAYGLAVWGTQTTAGAVHGIYTNPNVNGDPVYIVAVK